MSKKVRVAKKDIICYKIVTKERKRGIFWIFHKPIYRALFYINYTYRLKELNDLGKSLVIVLNSDLERPYAVNNGFHSFVDIQDAKRMLSEWYDEYDNQGGPAIVQCVIPKGAKYIKGTISQYPISPASYVSNKIICLKEV